jgi:hypothetical protein
MMSIRSLADFNGAPWAVRRLVGTATVTAQAPRSGSTRRTRGGDFYLATSGDLHLAISEDFPMAMDTSRPSPPTGRSQTDDRTIADRVFGPRSRNVDDQNHGVGVAEFDALTGLG